MKRQLKFRVYNSADKEVAVIHKQSNSIYSVERFDTNLPFLLQKPELTSTEIEYFLSTRILNVSKHYVIEELKQNNISEQDTLVYLLKRNSGRTLTDKFYILVEENGILSQKSIKTSINEELIELEDWDWDLERQEHTC